MHHIATGCTGAEGRKGGAAPSAVAEYGAGWERVAVARAMEGRAAVPRAWASAV